MENLNAKTLGLHVAYYRKLHNLTQIQLAEKSEISVRYVSLIETGRLKHYPSMTVLEKLCQALDISMVHLISPFDGIIEENKKGKGSCYDNH